MEDRRQIVPELERVPPTGEIPDGGEGEIPPGVDSESVPPLPGTPEPFKDYKTARRILDGAEPPDVPPEERS